MYFKYISIRFTFKNMFLKMYLSLDIYLLENNLYQKIADIWSRARFKASGTWLMDTHNDN